jgi:hypothetical protein
MSPTHRPGTPGSTLDDRPLFTESAVQTAGRPGHGERQDGNLLELTIG